MLNGTSDHVHVLGTGGQLHTFLTSVIHGGQCGQFHYLTPFTVRERSFQHPPTGQGAMWVPQFSCCPSSNLVITLTELPQLQHVLQTWIKQHQSETVTVYLHCEFTIIPLHIPTSTPILATQVKTSGVTWAVLFWVITQPVVITMLKDGTNRLSPKSQYSITTLHYVISQQRTDIICFMAEARNFTSGVTFQLHL